MSTNYQFHLGNPFPGSWSVGIPDILPFLNSRASHWPFPRDTGTVELTVCLLMQQWRTAVWSVLHC